MKWQTHIKDRYRVFDAITIQMGKNKVIISSRRVGASKLLSFSELELLLSCQTFDTLTRHAEYYCRQQKWEQFNNRKGLLGRLFRSLSEFAKQEEMELPVREKEMKSIRQQLQEYVDDGLLVSEAELQKEVRVLVQQNRTNGSTPNKIPMMGIPTCGRPETLRRCMESFTDNFHRR